MGDDHNVQQIAVDLGLLGAVQTTLYDYMEGFTHAEVLEVKDN